MEMFFSTFEKHGCILEQGANRRIPIMNDAEHLLPDDDGCRDFVFLTPNVYFDRRRIVQILFCETTASEFAEQVPWQQGKLAADEGKRIFKVIG
jgi:hypothetical protein